LPARALFVDNVTIGIERQNQPLDSHEEKNEHRPA
jgi:hypothetical protein